MMKKNGSLYCDQLEGYRSDFLQIQMELSSVRGQIDDAREFINTHQVQLTRVLGCRLYVLSNVGREIVWH